MAAVFHWEIVQVLCSLQTTNFVWQFNICPGENGQEKEEVVVVEATAPGCSVAIGPLQ